MSERAILVGVIVLLLLAVLHLAAVLLAEIDRVVEAIDLAAATGLVSTTRSPPRNSPPAYPIRRTGRTGRIASTMTFAET